MTTPRLTEESDPFCLQPADAAVLLANAPWRRFGVMGDSLSAGVGDASPGYASLGWSDRVAGVLRRVRPDLSYLNTAEIGSTTGRAVENQMDRVLAFAPDLLHLPRGANDIIRHEPAFDEIERTLRRMYEIAARTGAQLTTFTLGKAYAIPTIPDWHDPVRELNDVTRRLAADHGAVVVDMWDHPLNERETLLSADRIHFSASGQAVMASEMITELACMLDRAADPPPDGLADDPDLLGMGDRLALDESHVSRLHDAATERRGDHQPAPPPPCRRLEAEQETRAVVLAACQLTTTVALTMTGARARPCFWTSAHISAVLAICPATRGSEGRRPKRATGVTRRLAADCD